MPSNIISRIAKIATNPSRIGPAIARRMRLRSLSKELVFSLFSSRQEFDELNQELLECDLIPRMNKDLRKFDELAGNSAGKNQYGSGTMSQNEGLALYALTRKLKPSVIVETGVCSGFSTALILQALRVNNHGHLYSIDFPEVIGEEYTPDTFWEGKGCAVVPKGKESGWLVPDELRDRWTLKLGKSQELLPPLLIELNNIDIFIHDSEHSYECMMFEYQNAYASLRKGGLLISDDILWNTSFFDFAKQHGMRAGHIGGTMGLLIKA